MPAAGSPEQSQLLPGVSLKSRDPDAVRGLGAIRLDQPANDGWPPMLNNAHILFADDDGYYRDLGSEVLAEQGYRVTTASDGADCLAALRDERFDMAIVDLEMPRVNGFDVLANIRKSPEHGQMPVIVITGHDDTASIEKAYHSGASSFMTKPFDWALFTHQVRFVLKAAQTSAELRDSVRNIEFMRSLQDRFLQSLVEDAHAPLRSTMNLATIMELEADGPVGTPYYKTCIAEIAAGLRRIQGTHLKMLQWSENIGAAIKLNEGIVDLRTLLRLSSEETEARCRRRHVTFNADIRYEGDPKLSCDRALFIQALQCVLDDATRLTRPAGEVRMTATIDGDRGLVIGVEDEAAMHAELCDDPDAPPRKKSGDERLPTTLQVARAIVEAHGGTFKMKPDRDRGASTEIVMPARRLLCGTSALTKPARDNALAMPLAQPQLGERSPLRAALS